MKKLHQIVKERHEKQIELYSKIEEFEKEKDKLEKEIQELLRLEDVGQKGLDLEKIQITENILYVEGNPYRQVDHSNGITIADLAILDISDDCKHMRTQFFGNKRYSGYYQRCNCEYRMGPRHGRIVDAIGLKEDKELTDEEKDACIYYLKNYSAIKKTKEITHGILKD